MTQPIRTRRRSLLALASLASSATLAAPGLARAATELKLGYPLPLNSQFGAGATGFADELARLTQGSGDVYAWRADVVGGTRAKGSQQGLGEVRHAAQSRAPRD